jgi:hypothetical protein
MSHQRRFGILGLAAFIVLLTGTGRTARADFLQVTFHETGFNDVTIIDQTPSDLNPAPNQILAIVPNTFTDYSGSVSVNSSNPPIGTQPLSLNPNITANTAGASPLIITATQTGFTSPGAAGSRLNFTSTLAVSTLTSGTVGLTSSIGASLGTSTPPQSLSSPGTNTQTLIYTRGTTYGLSVQTTIILTGVGDSTNYSATATASTVPEPASVTLALIGAGLAGLAGWRQWRQHVPA